MRVPSEDGRLDQGQLVEPGLVEVITDESSAPGERHAHLSDHVGEIAVVSSPEIRNLWSSLVSPFIKCDVEHFAPDQIEEARDWLMWPEGAADV